MIIQIRGTSGSGKSTVVRKLFPLFGPWNPETLDTRKNPLYYMSQDGRVLILGHYETDCGGCDTIGSAPEVFKLIKQFTKPKFIVCEGLLLSEDVKWSLQMKDLRVIFLVTPLEQCLQNIKTRRARKGNEKELNPKNTSNRVAVIERARLKLTEAGVYCVRASADQAPRIIERWINGSGEKNQETKTV